MPVDIETDTGADAADYDVDTIRRMIDEALRLPPRETPSDAGEGIQGAPSKAVSVIRPVDDGLRAILDYLQLEVRRNARNLRIEVRRKGGGRESDRWAEQWGESPQPGGWIAFGDAIASSSHQISRKLFRFTFEERADRPAVWAERDFNEALLVCCPRAPVDPFKEWLESLPAWDGINRIDSLWIETLGMSDSELCREAGRRFLIGAVRRTYEPGAVHDWIPVLVGAQGRGKSSILRELVVSPDWFSDSTQLDGDNKQRMETTGGAVISEFSEMAGLDRADAARFKSYLSQRDDQLRPAYARYPVRLPRRWVGVGTTNPDPAGVLPGDPTGARRYVVLRSDSEGSVNELAALAEQGRAWVKKYREQLWAETVAEYRIAVKRGDTAMNLMPGHLRAAQEEAASGERRAFDGMRDVVIGLMAYGQEPERFKNGVTLAELMMQAGLSETLSDAAKDRSSQRELGTELTAAHWVKRRRQVNGVKAWRWFAPMPKDEALIPTTSEAVETIVVPVIGELDESGEWFLPWRKVLRQLLDKDVHQKAFRELLGRAIVHDDFVSLDLDFIYRTLHIYVQNEASGKGEISHLADYARLPGEDCEGCRELMRHANAPPPGQGELLPAVAPRQRVFTDPAVRKRD